MKKLLQLSLSLLLLTFFYFFSSEFTPVNAQTCNGGGTGTHTDYTCARNQFAQWTCVNETYYYYAPCSDTTGTCRRQISQVQSEPCQISGEFCTGGGGIMTSFTTSGCYLCYFRPAIWNAYTNKFEYQPGETIFFTGVAGNNHCEPGSSTLSMNPGGSFSVFVGAYGSASRTVSFSRSAYGNYSVTACYGGSCMSDTFHICGVVPAIDAFSLNKSIYQPGEAIIATIRVRNADCRPGNITVSVGGVSRTVFLGSRASTTLTLTFTDNREGAWHTATAVATGLNGSDSATDTYYICGFRPALTAFSLNGDRRYQTNTETITATVTVQNSDCKINNTANVVVSDAQGSITISFGIGANTSVTATGSWTRSVAAYLTSTARIAGSARSLPYTVAGRVSGIVTRYYNSGGVVSNSGERHAGAVVSANGRSDATDGNGFYTILDLDPGTHAVVITQPTGYRNPPGQSGSVTRTFGPDQTVNFGVQPRYTISGNVFIDANLDRLRNAGESNYTYPGYVPNITVSGGIYDLQRFLTTRSDGTYFINNVPAGTFAVRFNNVPRSDEYFIFHPRNGPPPSFSVTLGGSCATGLPTPGGGCSGDNLQNLNFGIHRARPWVQIAGGSVRMDNGWTNPIPRSADVSCGGPNAIISGTSQRNPGVYYSGDALSFFNQGQASQNPYNFRAGGTQYPETHRTGSSGTLRTSYSFVQSSLRKAKITPANIVGRPGGCSALGACTLSSTLASGNYIANGSMTLTGNSSIGSGNQSYIILVNGDLRINGPVQLSAGSSVVFVVSGNIYVSSGVGAAPSCSATPQLEGIYSADRSFIVEGINNCMTGVDRTLTVGGVVITNAGLQGGGLQMNRNICDFNFDYPSFRILKNLSHILNVSDLLWVENNIWQEVAP